MSKRPLPATKYRRAARGRVLRMGAAMPTEPPTVRAAIVREVYLREMTLPDLAALLDLTPRAVFQRLAPPRRRPGTAITPAFLDQVVAVLHITPRVARRLHYLGAVAAGWNVGESSLGHGAEPQPPAARSLVRVTSPAETATGARTSEPVRHPGRSIHSQ